MSERADVAVVIPVRDRAAMLVEAIASVLAQTHPPRELVVVDDGSIDGSADVAERLLVAAPLDARVLRLAAGGVAAARNAGVAASAAPWIAFLDSDDLWLPTKLERQLAWVAARPAYRIVQSEERWLDRGRHRNPRRCHRKEERLFVRSLERCLVSPSAVVMRRGLFAEHHGFDASFAVCEDYELWLRITRREPVGLVPETLVVKRGGHPGQLSRSTWGLDRFRVAALVTLLATTRLTPAEHAAVAAAVVAKCGVLASGAARRGRHDEAERYRALAAVAASAREPSARGGAATAANGNPA